MTPKGGTLFFLLIMAGVALTKPPDEMDESKYDFTKMAKKLMRKCVDNDYRALDRKQLKTIFNNSDMPMGDGKESDTFLSTFLKVQGSVSPDKPDKDPQDDKMPKKKWKSTNLPTMIKLMRNASVPPQCYLHAFVAPLAWSKLMSPRGNNLPADDYDTVVRAAKYALENMPPRGMKLPADVGRPQNLEKMMDILKEVYGSTSDQQKTQVVRWLREQIVQKDFNCNMGPPPDPKKKKIARCKPTLKWMNLKAWKLMGPYISNIPPRYVDSSPIDELCTFFQSAQFKSSTAMIRKMKPSLGMKLMQKFEECPNRKPAITNDVDKLGPVACFYTAATELTPELSKKLLSELNDREDCANPRITKLKNHLVKSVISKSEDPEVLRKLGGSLNLLSSEQLDKYPPIELKKALKEGLKNRKSALRWKPRPLRTLVKKLLGDKCKRLSGEELKEFAPIAEGLPSCVFKHKEILNDTEGLKTIAKRMKKRQLMALLQGPLKDMDPTELLQKVSPVKPLLCRLPLNKLDKANITSLEQVADKMWCLPQALFLVKKMYNPKKPWYWRLRSLVQGVTCEMIDKVPDNKKLEMAQAITENPQWLSKPLAGCAARQLTKALEKKRDNFYKTITEEELEEIPAELLIHLPPSKVKDLPEILCPIFLEKMDDVDLSSLPPQSPSRRALTQKVLLCEAKGKDLSELTEEDVSRLGPFICGLQPSELIKVKVPEVLKAILQEMACCEHISQQQRADLIQLAKKTFGDPSDWSIETTEALVALILCDEAATAALPNKPWMKVVLYFLRPSLCCVSRTLGKKLFDLTTASDTVTPSKNKRSTVRVKELTKELIEELEMDNIHWTASEFQQMTPRTFHDTVETLGSVRGYSEDQLIVLSQKATETFGPMSQMNESVLLQMGCIIRGLSNADLEQLPLSLDNVDEIAKCGWNASQMELVWKAVAKYNNLTAQGLGAADIIALDQFICGLSATEMGQLKIDAFKDAVASMEDVKCQYKVLKQLKMLAVSAFGEPKTWTEALVSELKCILAGLDKAELASLNPSVLSFFRTSCIQLIPPDNFAAFSVAQLEALGPDNAAMVTSEQRQALKQEQLDALKKAVTGSSGQSEGKNGPNSGSLGAPSLSVKGISAVLKALLFLLMGFLLL